MISVVIETLNDEEALAHTLASLVSGSVEGVVREVLVHDLGSTDHTRLVADHAGCVLLADDEFQAGLKRARGDWLLFLEPGARLCDGWIDAVMHHAGQGSMPARFERSRIGSAPFLARMFSASRPLADGLLMSKRQALALLKGATNLTALSRVSTRRLSASIISAPRRRRS